MVLLAESEPEELEFHCGHPTLPQVSSEMYLTGAQLAEEFPPSTLSIGRLLSGHNITTVTGEDKRLWQNKQDPCISTE